MSFEHDAEATKAVILIVGETIKELGRVPSGQLYALLMDKMSIETYKMIILTLKDMGVVQEKNNVLSWIGKK